LLINLYDINSTANRDMHRVRVKGCKVVKDLSLYNNIDVDNSNPVLRYHVSKVNNALSIISEYGTTRTFQRIGHNFYDNLNEIEKLGVTEYSRAEVIIFSLERYLNYILHMLSNCDPLSVSSIPQYTELSRSILSMDLDVLTKLSTKLLYGIDDKLDCYLHQCSIDSKLYVPDVLTRSNNVKMVYWLFNQLYEKCNDVLLSVFSALRDKNYLGGKDPNTKKYTPVVARSYGYSNMVFTGYGWPINEEPIIEITDGVHQSFKVNLAILKPMEYLHTVQSGITL